MTTTATTTVPAQWATKSGVSSQVQAAQILTTTMSYTSAKDTRAAEVLTTSTISGTLIRNAAATGVPMGMGVVAGALLGVVAAL